MKRREQENLLKEILADDALDALRENSLAGGLTALQSRRRGRALRTAALAGIPLLILSAILLRPGREILPATPPNMAVASVVSSSLKIYPAAAASEAPPISTISDEELLALFPDQSVGLLGAAGQQKLVVFDQPRIAMK